MLDLLKNSFGLDVDSVVLIIMEKGVSTRVTQMKCEKAQTHNSKEDEIGDAMQETETQ